MLKSKTFSFLKKYILIFQEVNRHLLRICFSGCLYNGFSKDMKVLLGFLTCLETLRNLEILRQLVPNYPKIEQLPPQMQSWAVSNNTVQS